MMTRKPVIFLAVDRLSLGILLLFAFLFASISWANHYFFRTDALDLGAYINATYDYSHGQWNDSSSFLNHPANFLTDHFDLLVVFFSPLSWLFKDWTLLLLQWLSILCGAVGVYRYFLLRQASVSFARSAMLFYLLQFGVFGALSFNYHSSVVAAALVPFLLVAIEQQNKKHFLLVFILILIAKESMSLWLFFILTGLIFIYRSHPWRKFMAGSALVALVWFCSVTLWVMPSLTDGGGLTQFKFSIVGNSLGDLFAAVLHRPMVLVDALFNNHLGTAGVNGVKEEFWMLFLLSGGLVLLARPVYLWMILPIFLMKMWSDRTLLWGINYHYNIELVPILSIGVFSTLMELTDGKIRRRLVVACILLAAAVSIRCMDHTEVWVRRENIRVYQKKHWQSALNRKAVVDALQQLPADVIVSAQSCLQPHVAWRDNAYLFPHIANAEYVFLAPATNTYPLSRDEFTFTKDSLLASKRWSRIVDKDGVLLLKKN